MKCNRGCCRLKTWKNNRRPWKQRAPSRKRAGVILVCDTSVLLVQTYGDHWGFPKGAIEDGETEAETASRELFEETGIFMHAETLKTYGFRMVVVGGILFILRIDKRLQPDTDIARSIDNNDSSGVGWVNIKCIVNSRDLNCNKHLRKFIEYMARYGIERWMSEYTTKALVIV